MYKEDQVAKKQKRNEFRTPRWTRRFFLRRKMALKHFRYRRKLRIQAKVRARIEKYYAQNSQLRRENYLELHRRKTLTIGAVILSILGCGLLVFPTIASEPSGIPSGTLDMFNANDIPYWDPCAGGGSGNSGGGGTASEVEGDDNQAKIWNWFVNAGIDGVSDDPNVIAGIMGNIAVETAHTFDPFIRGGGGGAYYGLFMMGQYFPNFPPTIESAAGGSYWWLYPGPAPSIPSDANDKAIAATLDYATTDAEPGVSSWANFIGNLGVVTNKNARGYADLFMVTFENCFNGDSVVEDPGVAAIASYATWQGGVARRDSAEEIFNKFGSGGAKTTTGSSSSSKSDSSSSSKTLNSSSSSSKTSSSSDGSDVLIIGDSITNRSKSEIQALLPKAKINVKDGRTFQEGIAELKSESNPRDIIVFALGSNSSNVSEAQAKEVISLAGDDREVIFVTNYSLGKVNYDHNNSLFESLAKEYDNVSIADWAAAVSSDPDKYIAREDVDVHPSEDGTKLFAETIYDAVTGGGGDDGKCGFNGTIDAEGWITDGIEGLEKESVAEGKWPAILENPNCGKTCEGPGALNKTWPDGSAKAITLHYTAGSGPLTGGALHIYEGNMFPPHFTVDLRSKKGYQHRPMDHPSYAVASYDAAAGIQFEIVGTGFQGAGGPWASVDPGGPWDLQNFTDEEWDYLAQYLLAVSEYTGVPLETSVDWSTSQEISVEQMNSYTGIIGHQHIPENGKVDPGNIWDQVKAAIDRAGGGGTSCGEKVTDLCGNVTGTKPASGSVSALQEYVLKYAWKASDPEAGSATPKPEYAEAFSKAPYKGGGITDCGAFVQILMHESGWDSNFYGVGATGAMMTWLQTPANGWEKITPTDVSQLQPGDVAVWDDGMGNGHTWVFVGDIPGFGSQFADASWGSRTPAATTTGLHYNGETWFRKKGQ